MERNCSKVGRQDLPNPQKTFKNLRFFKVFHYSAFWVKRVSNRLQIDTKAAKLRPKWSSWRLWWPILALLVAVLAPSCSNMSSKKPPDGARTSLFLMLFWRWSLGTLKTPPKFEKCSQNALKIEENPMKNVCMYVYIENASRSNRRSTKSGSSRVVENSWKI